MATNTGKPASNLFPFLEKKSKKIGQKGKELLTQQATDNIGAPPEKIELEAQVLKIVKENWPISALGIAKHFSENTSSREHRKKHSTRYAYYLKKLVKKRRVLSKRIGNALVVWPLEVEAYRAIHNILKESEEPLTK